MSVTQYIGARYVPLFADPLTWDITKAYEALTIVYYQGNSFTSRQAVPAGIDITNDQYWALTGNYNAQIEQYRAEVQTYDGRITANTASNTAQDAQLAGTSSSGLKTLIDANTASNTAQDAQLAGTATSGLKTLIDANAGDIDALEQADTAIVAQLAGTSTSGLKTLIDANASDISSISDAISPLMQLAHAPVYMVPTYMGDYMINEQFGCVAHHAKTFYCFNTGNYDNTGELRIYSEQSNALVSKKRIQVGHANSCAYDTIRNVFWIAPHMTYSGGVSTYTTDLYKYDTEFNVLTVVPTGADNTVFAVSFDSVRNVLCAYNRTGAILTCLEMASDASTFTEAWSADMSTFAYSTWQDAFCNDGLTYLLQPEGTVHIIDATGTVIGSGEVSNYDDNNYWHFGEHEGWECDEHGAVYMARNGAVGLTMSGDRYPINNAFVTCVSFGTKTRDGVNARNAPYPTATISSDDQGTFKLQNNHLRSLNQINFLIHEHSTIVVGAGDSVVEEYGMIRLPTRSNLTILILGTYELFSVSVTGGDYAFVIGDQGTLKIDTTSYFISMDEYRSPIIRYRSRGTIIFNGTQFIHPTYSNLLAYIKTGTDPIVYHTTTIPANSNGVFFGTKAIYKDWS